MGRIMDRSTLISLAAFAAALLAMKFLPRLMAGVPFVPPADLKSKLDQGEEVLIIDVRSEAEFTGELGHIPGALNMPLNTLTDRLTETKSSLEPYLTTPIYVMCMTAGRSPRAARALRQFGFTNLRVLDGGMSRWKRQGLPSTRRG